MLKRLNRLVLGALLATSSPQAMAQSAGWLVSEVRGPVTIVSSLGRSAATRGATLHPGDTITTGAGARAVIVRNKDFVTVAPHSRIRIPAETRGSGVTQFFQDIGNAIFNVGKRATPHFSVDTPYLAAVVKGTVFSVTVDRDRTVLQVTEGAVEVSTTDGGARDLIRPGSIAMIAANDRYRLTISGDAARVVDSPARPSTPEPAPTAPPDPATDASALPPPAAKAANGEVAGVRIMEAVASKPVDLALATNGVLTGLSPAGAAAAASTLEAAPRRSAPSGLSGANRAEDRFGGGTTGDKLDTGKLEYQPDIGKPGEHTDTGKPEDKPDAGKPEDTPDPGKPGDTPDPGKPEGTPAGKPEDTPDGKPEGTPDAGKPEDTPAGKPEDTPDGGKPEDTPDAGRPDDKPDTVKPDPGKPK